MKCDNCGSEIKELYNLRAGKYIRRVYKCENCNTTYDSIEKEYIKSDLAGATISEIVEDLKAMKKSVDETVEQVRTKLHSLEG